RDGDAPGSDHVSHVGVIVDVDPSDGNSWQTGDSGQDSGSTRGASYRTRLMRKEDGTHPYLEGENTTSLRRIGGWGDLEEVLTAMVKRPAFPGRVLQRCVPAATAEPTHGELAATSLAYVAGAAPIKATATAHLAGPPR